MRISTRVLIVLGICVVLLFAFPISASALQADISVNPILPENQVDASVQYFNLLLHPGERQELSVQVTNFSDNALQVSVETIAASTTEEGMINYVSQATWIDPSLRYPFPDLVEIPFDRIEIPAGESRDVSLFVHMPEQAIEGVVLGIIRIIQDTVEDTDALSPNHQFSYSIPVQLANSIQDPIYSFELGEIYLLPKDDVVEISAHVRNTAPFVVKNARIQAIIYDINDDEIVLNDTEGIEMAPNSIYLMHINDAPNFRAEPGQYRVHVRIQIDDEEWSLEGSVHREETDLSGEDYHTKPPFRIPQVVRLVLYIIGVIVVVGTLAFLILLFHIHRQNRKHDAYMRHLKQQSQSNRRDHFDENGL